MTAKTGLSQPTIGAAGGAGGWGTTLNNNFGILDNALGGNYNASLSGGDLTLTATQAQNVMVTASGASAIRNLAMGSGNVGTWVVNNTSSYALNVYTVLTTGSYVTIVAGKSAIVFSPDGSNMYEAPNNYVLRTGDTMTGSLALPSNGLNVGSGQLQVSGGNVLSTGSFQANVNVTALSDERVKENIETIEGALAMVKQMRGVRYKRKDTGDTQVGVISQEMEKVVPEAVIHGREGLLHVAYGNLVGVLINAIKELEDRVSKLEG
jgi:type IV secretory pathway protease TraF